MQLLCSLHPHIHLKHWQLVGYICAAYPKLAEEYVVSTGVGALCLKNSVLVTKMGTTIRLLRIAIKSVGNFLKEVTSHKISTDDEKDVAEKINHWCAQLHPNKVLIYLQSGIRELTIRFHNSRLTPS